jgi:hypothetical protein
MIIEALWFSQQGTRTSDNRDHAGIGIRQREFLGVVVDGSTNGAANGEYARSIVQMLVDWFVETGDVITDDLMVRFLGSCMRTCASGIPEDPRASSSSMQQEAIPSASFILVIVSSGNSTRTMASIGKPARIP